ncbi:DUF3397 domain-containing protein [Halobacillus salinus]|uniref:DUF3397 domain-containing protein n=1 Tax=Halobacillus salinus TaxID=192814 RepID=A0A4Z0H7V1_9BACI|nr:DUF3397 domain-containing protein [Halobacillus salinus]TGB05015.1 DUF3397 domain-containing protein [Halobacillus salinus]
MAEVIIFIMAAILTMPIPFLFVFYFLSRRWHGRNKKAVHQTAAFSAPVFILAVHVLMLVLFQQSFFAYIVIFLMILLGLSLVIQYKLHDEIRFIRAFRGFWRAAFLLFTVVYMGLSIFGILGRIVS